MSNRYSTAPWLVMTWEAPVRGVERATLATALLLTAEGDVVKG